MTKENSLDYISVNSVLSDLDEKLTTMKRKVTHGKLKIQKKKIKSQVMKKHKPTDHERNNICKKAREKAHSVTANARRNISNDVREGLQVVNPNAFTLTERYELDFIEESVGYDIDIKFFDKPEITPVTEGLSVGTTKTGKQRKCKAIGVAEGCFAPITDPDGGRVFSRNNRLYEETHWEYQLENQNLLDRVNTRRMLGTIGHYDKKVDDVDLAEGKVSHIVTDLEIREDDTHGRYLWGRLEIINTEAGRRLKEYYDNDIPLYVSSRGGGKLLDVHGESYKMVDKTKYFCETFDVVKEPGFLEAQPQYIKESDEETLERLIREIADKHGLKIDETKLMALKSTICESIDAELDEDNNMSKVNVDVTATDTMEQIVKKVIQPMQDETQNIVKALAESVAKLTDVVAQVKSDIYEDETPAEEPAEAEVAEVEAPAEEVAEEPVQESEDAEKAPEAEVEVEEVIVNAVAQAIEEIEEAKDEDKEEKEDKKDCDKDKDCKKEAPKKEEKEEIKEEAEEEPKAEEPAEEVAPTEEAPEAEAEPVEEQWAHVDPKETVSDKAEHKASQGGEQKPLAGDCWANEPAPAKSDIHNAENAPQEADPTNHEEKPAVDGAIIEEAEPVAEAPVEAEVAEEEQEVVDYQAAYETIKAEVAEATQLVDDLTRLFDDFGKKHVEVVAESKETNEKLNSRIAELELELNSYKISEKFDVTIETAKEMLSAKSYEEVATELKESEANKLEEETQAKAQEVSESITTEATEPKAPVSRKVYTRFATPESTPAATEISEAKGRQVYSWFKG